MWINVALQFDGTVVTKSRLWRQGSTVRSPSVHLCISKQIWLLFVVWRQTTICGWIDNQGIRRPQTFKYFPTQSIVAQNCENKKSPKMPLFCGLSQTFKWSTFNIFYMYTHDVFVNSNKCKFALLILIWANLCLFLFIFVTFTSHFKYKLK